MIVKRVEVNSLLEDVDIEDLRLMAQNTNRMNQEFMEMMGKWENINRRAEEGVKVKFERSEEFSRF
jgi:hypothetical protein